ncbi:MFS transporter [Burkholderia sp. MSh2]|uniref:MFS transporter n=1 Tax=Burkholderia paludis TaxID=1506587 RepID=A0A6J5EQI9_9BURK|nr:MULTISPECIES: MFS transporter [Burkholderia]KEZ06306.1 MFS transporter [Burkholderia sp. MSh2]CAB3767987.1 Drug efflux pump JefA [Burkholderia paludis]VWC31544.1 MFS transporter [Burkholderia paludis]
MKNRRRYLLALLVAGFMTIFDLFVVNVAIVNIERTLHASYLQLTLIIVAYELSFGIFLIPGGRLGDLWGRRGAYRIGMLLFTLASVACGLAVDAGMLIAARFLQGMSAALLFPQVYASIRADLDGAEARKAYGYLGMALGLAAVAGQVLGGLLISIDFLDLQWRTIFFVNVPVGVAALCLSGPLNAARVRPAQSLDWLGIALSSVGISVSLLPLLMISAWGWGIRSSALLLAGGLVLYCFARHERRYARSGRAPLVDMALLRDRPFLKGSLLVMCLYATAGSFTLVFSILLQSGLRMSPLQAGMTYVATSIGFSLSSVLMPKLIGRHGARLVFLGAALYAASFVLLTIVVLHAPIRTRPGLLVPALFALGLTQGMVMTPLLNIVMANVRDAFAGMAAGVLATLQQVGAAFGVTAVSTIMQVALGTLSGHGPFLPLRNAFACSMLFNVAAAALAGVLLRSLPAQAQRA